MKRFWYNLYVLESIAFGVVALLSLVVGIYFFVKGGYFLTFLSALAFYVALDNFFCSSRARRCGIKVRGHYTLPWFLR